MALWAYVSSLCKKRDFKYQLSTLCNAIFILEPLACIAPIGMESGGIPDAQITASSEWDVNHAAFQARLQFQAGAGKAGSWSAKTNDVTQWLQVDIGSETEVKRVATQGRNGYAQWVTSYKLQFGNDGTSFQYYREQGDNADTVWYFMI